VWRSEVPCLSGCVCVCVCVNFVAKLADSLAGLNCVCGVALPSPYLMWNTNRDMFINKYLCVYLFCNIHMYAGREAERGCATPTHTFTYRQTHCSSNIWFGALELPGSDSSVSIRIILRNTCIQSIRSVDSIKNILKEMYSSSPGWWLINDQ
jgi:hypothetical protein